MKNKFFVFKPRRTLAVVSLILLGAVAIFTPILVSATSHTYVYSVAIDAGHGGIDGGCVGASGISESKLNLAYAKTLQQFFLDFGFKVTMTRTNDDGLYSMFASNKKRSEMLKRKEIIEKSNADIVISLHMNSYPSKSSRGAQVFYNNENQNSKVLAECIQKQIVSKLVNPRHSAEKGDYYVINCTSKPGVIVECGFLSNPEEEKLLLNDEYRQKVCYAILCGVIAYYGLI